MKGKRRFGVLLIIAALIIMQLPVSEADAATSASDFKIQGSKLIKYRGDEVHVTIPNTVETIGEGAFEENDKIKSVVVPNSVTEIERYAFWGCDNLDTVTLGSGIKEIGSFTFANCKGLEYMTIPKTVTSIGMQAFVDCVNLTDITIPVEVIQIHDSAFDGCYQLYIHCTAGSIADEYAKAFYEKQAEMPEYEDVPDYDATEDEEEEEDDEDSLIYEPVPGRLIGSSQIVGNNAMVFIESENQNVLDGSVAIPEVQNPIENQMQSSQIDNIPKYTIVNDKVVADQAYYRSTALGHVVLPDGIEEIGMFAFSRSSVVSIKVPEGTKDICYGAFYHCDKLEKVFLPDTIENVEPKAFENSLWVKNFEAKGTEDFLISGNVLVAYRGVNKNITIPEGVTVIAGEVFAGNAQITNVTLPESLVTIGEGAFEGCRNLMEVNFGSKITKIKDRAFLGCPIGKIIVPTSVSEMGLQVFDANVEISYEGEEMPITTYEQSAQRLSNEEYRTLMEETAASGVKVNGIESGIATLEGANRAYTLSIVAAEDKTLMETAYRRSYTTELPETMVVYDLQLTDSSQIPLTKLGRRNLMVAVPIPEGMEQENLLVFTLDRNGQLEKLPTERVKIDGKDAVSFKTTYVSTVGICGDGSVYNAEDVLEVSTSIVSMSKALETEVEETETVQNGPLVYVKWGAALLMLLAGSVLVLSRKRA